MTRWQVRYLSGPNRWSDRTMIAVSAIAAAAGVDRQVERQALEHRVQHLASIPFSDPLETSADERWPTRLIAQLVLKIQQQCGEPVRQFVESDSASDSLCAIEYANEATARRCVELAEQIWETALGERSYSWDKLPACHFRANDKLEADPTFLMEQQLAELCHFADDQRLGRTTVAIVAAAEANGIPVQRLDQAGLVQLGQGARQQRIQAATTCHTGFIAELVSRDKWLTKSLLQKLGVPVSIGRAATSAEQAWGIANELGLPVVIKPRDADFGLGVAIRLESRDEIQTAFHEAQRHGSGVLVEKFLTGFHHRVLVVGNRVIAAIRREPAHVIGDGQSTVEALITAANRDPRRGADDDLSAPWFWLQVDAETKASLARQNFSLTSIPPVGQRVVLRWNPSEWTGDSIFDVTDEIDPQVAEMLVDAVQMIGLDIAGIDLMAENLCIPFSQQEAGILEINAEPALLIHMGALTKTPDKVPHAIVRHLFPKPNASRIPIAVVLGWESDHETTALAEALHDTWRPDLDTGLATRDGAWLGPRRLRADRCDNRSGVQTLLLHPRAEAAVCELSFETLENEGLPFDHCDLLLVVGTAAEADPALLELAMRHAARVEFRPATVSEFLPQLHAETGHVFTV